MALVFLSKGRSEFRRSMRGEVNSEDLCADMLRATRRLTLTRRSLLQNSAWIAAATMFPRLAAAVVHDVSPVMEKLSSYMAGARNRALPDNVEQETKHHILDTIAAMVSGSELPPGHMAIEFARSYGGEKIATVVASRILCGPIEAAFANGELANSDETDDDFTTGGAHPGCAVVPAA